MAKRSVTAGIHVFGASGTGTSSLGEVIAQRWEAVHLDSDDYLWLPTDPPYQRTRPPAQRRRMLLAELRRHPRWVLSGSCCGWGDVIMPYLVLAVFLLAPRDVRLARLRAREANRFGPRIEPGGDMHEVHREFLKWASQYDRGGMAMRSRAQHEEWARELPCPLLRLDGRAPVAANAAVIMDDVREPQPRRYA